MASTVRSESVMYSTQPYCSQTRLYKSMTSSLTILIWRSLRVTLSSFSPILIETGPTSALSLFSNLTVGNPRKSKTSSFSSNLICCLRTKPYAQACTTCAFLMKASPKRTKWHWTARSSNSTRSSNDRAKKWYDQLSDATAELNYRIGNILLHNP